MRRSGDCKPCLCNVDITHSPIRSNDLSFVLCILLP